MIHLLRTSEALNDKRPADDSKHEEHRQEEEEEYYYDDDEYELSGDFEMPQGNAEVKKNTHYKQIVYELLIVYLKFIRIFSKDKKMWS